MRSIIRSKDESREIARAVASKLSPGDIVLLEGDLGSGKSFFCGQIIQNFCGADTQVSSPTFNLVSSYNAKGFDILHYDLYRMKNPIELLEIGFEDMIEGNISLIEWPQMLLRSNIIANTDNLYYIKLEIKNTEAQAEERIIETNIY